MSQNKTRTIWSDICTFSAMKFLLLYLFLSIGYITISQESLLLGEIKLDELKPEQRNDDVKKILIYEYKFKKRGNYKDSTLQGFQDFSEEGYLLNRNSFFGRKLRNSVRHSYTYDADGNVLQYEQLFSSGEGLNARIATFQYNQAGRAVEQQVSLATIRYAYHADGRLKTKSYYYNNRGALDTEPWTHYYFYNEDKQLIHVDTDENSEQQTSYYDDQGNLVRHDYYPGYAYTTYKYDDQGNCIRQVDFEKDKNDWDSTVFQYNYDAKGRLILSSSSNKRGKIQRDQEWVYNEKGQIDHIIEYKRDRPKRLYRYFFEYY